MTSGEEKSYTKFEDKQPLVMTNRLSLWIGFGEDLCSTFRVDFFIKC